MTVVSCRVLNKPMAWVRAEVVGHSVVSVFLQSGQNTRACPCNRKREASNVIFVPWRNVQRCKFPQLSVVPSITVCHIPIVVGAGTLSFMSLPNKGGSRLRFGSQHHFAFDVFRAEASLRLSLPSLSAGSVGGGPEEHHESSLFFPQPLVRRCMMHCRYPRNCQSSRWSMPCAGTLAVRKRRCFVNLPEPPLIMLEVS